MALHPPRGGSGRGGQGRAGEGPWTLILTFNVVKRVLLLTLTIRQVFTGHRGALVCIAAHPAQATLPQPAPETTQKQRCLTSPASWGSPHPPS